MKKTAPAEQVEAWIRQEDFTYAEQTPVALAFYLPEHVRAGHAADISPGAEPLLGTHCRCCWERRLLLLTLERCTGCRHTCGGMASVLTARPGRGGRALQRQIQQMIADFEAEARTERRRERAGSIAPLAITWLIARTIPTPPHTRTTAGRPLLDSHRKRRNTSPIPHLYAVFPKLPTW